MKNRSTSVLLAIPLIAAGLLGGLGGGPGGSTAVAATSADGTASAGDSLTCAGHGIDRAAQLHYRTEIFVKAPMNTVWRTLTDVEGWPDWQAAVTSMRKLDHGLLRKNSRFRWTTPVPATPVSPATTLVITSTVQQVERGQCVRWTGPAIGDGLRIDEGVHVWNFVKVRGGVLVRTEESWRGEQIEADPALAVRYLAAGLDTWLADLKTEAESRR